MQILKNLFTSTPKEFAALETCTSKWKRHSDKNIRVATEEIDSMKTRDLSSLDLGTKLRLYNVLQLIQQQNNPSWVTKTFNTDRFDKILDLREKAGELKNKIDSEILALTPEQYEAAAQSIQRADTKTKDIAARFFNGTNLTQAVKEHNQEFIKIGLLIERPASQLNWRLRDPMSQAIKQTEDAMFTGNLQDIEKSWQMVEAFVDKLRNQAFEQDEDVFVNVSRQTSLLKLATFGGRHDLVKKLLSYHIEIGSGRQIFWGGGIHPGSNEYEVQRTVSENGKTKLIDVPLANSEEGIENRVKALMLVGLRHASWLSLGKNPNTAMGVIKGIIQMDLKNMLKLMDARVLVSNFSPMCDWLMEPNAARLRQELFPNLPIEWRDVIAKAYPDEGLRKLNRS